MQSSYQKIHQSQDYQNFKFLERNRDINLSHVQRLKESILRENRLYLKPINVFLKDDNYWITDGQHRFTACKQLNIPFYYQINENFSEESIIDDQISRPWHLEDYLKYFSEQGLSEYIKIKNLIDKFQIPFQAIYYLLGNQKYENAKIFKEGKIKINEKIENFLKESNEFIIHSKNTYPKSEGTLFRRDFITSLFWFYKNFPIQFPKLITYLKDIFPEIPVRGTRRTYEDFLIAKSNIVKVGNKGIKHPKYISDQQ